MSHKTLTDEDMFPFGKYGPGKENPLSMKEVPSNYYRYLWNNGKKAEVGSNDVADYIQANLAALKQELPDAIWD